MKLIWTAGIQMKLMCHHPSCNFNLNKMSSICLSAPKIWVFIALVEHCSANAEVMDWNAIETLNFLFFRAKICNCLNCDYNCNDHISILSHTPLEKWPCPFFSKTAATFFTSIGRLHFQSRDLFTAEVQWLPVPRLGWGYRMDHGSVFNRLHSSCDDLQVSYHPGIFSRGNLNKVSRFGTATTTCLFFSLKFGIFSQNKNNGNFWYEIGSPQKR